MRRAHAGDQAALEAFASALYPVVRAALGRRVRRSAPVELDDLIQAAVARAVTRLDQCGAADDRGVRAWASAVAWRVALEEFRSGAAAIRRRSVPLFDDDHDPVGGREFAEDAPARHDAEDDPRTWLARAAVEALDGMPGHVGVLFWMRLIEEAPWPDIARALGTTTAGVKRRFQRAVGTLRRALTTGRSE